MRLTDSDTSGAVLAVGVRSVRCDDAAASASPVRPHVHSDRPGLATLLDALIGNAVRVAEATAAIDVAIAHPDAIVVTDVGDRFGAGCWRVGAARRRHHGGRARSGTRRVGRRRRPARRRRAGRSRRARRSSPPPAPPSPSWRARLDTNDTRFTAAAEALARVQGERRERSTPSSRASTGRWSS